MNEQPINPNDPGFLLSRQLDGDLTDDERRRIDDALCLSESLRDDAASMRKTNDILRRWAGAPVELDWEGHAALINARCQTDDTSQDQPELDGILTRWSQDDVAFDEDKFMDGVMQRIGGNARDIERPSSHRWMLRIAMPLAAAAILMFALIGGPWMSERFGAGVVENQLANTADVGPAPMGAPVCVVRFARVTPREPVEASPIAADRPGGISFTAIGIVTGSLNVAPANP